jgi:hypothetical protein
MMEIGMKKIEIKRLQRLSRDAAGAHLAVDHPRPSRQLRRI